MGLMNKNSEPKKGGLMGGLADAGLNALTGGMSGLMGGAVDKLLGLFGDDQYTQQQKLQDIQIKGAKEMADYNNQKQMEMWKATNAGAQRDELEKAGLSASLMYGGSGAGGGTTGSGGGGMPTSAGADSKSAMMMARLQAQQVASQIKLTEAQAKKTEVEADKTAGIDTDNAKEELKYKEFDNQVRDTVGYQGTANAIKWANEKIQIESEKANADWEAYKAGAFDGKAYDDKNSPIAKAIKSGFNQAVEELKGARLENNAKQAENVVKNFEARMAQNGIHPNSPWYVKLIGDLLEKVGVTDLLKAGANKMK